MVTDTPASPHPIGVVTGDFVFVGDVGRPDLLEKAAKVMGTMEAGARTLFRSLQRFKQLPDHLQIWPGHGAGSACGKALGAVPMSTLGYEKIANWGLRIDDEQEFVNAVLEGQPEPPKYFAEMKRINKMGPAILGGFARPASLDLAQLDALLAAGARIVDTRAADRFAAGHIPGTINIPLNKSFTTWAGWLLPYTSESYVIAGQDAIDTIVRDLAMIGLDHVAGVFSTDVVGDWSASGHTLATIAQRSPSEVAAMMTSPETTVIDVRGASEYDAGHLRGVRNIPVGYLTDHLGELPRETPLVLHCQGGARSAIAASVMRARGFTNVINMTGGFAAWDAAGLPVEHDVVAASAAAH
jgi:hydroxyacylglutathione hydrolase